MLKIAGVLLGCWMLAGCGPMNAQEAAEQEAIGSSEAGLSVYHPHPTCAEACSTIKDEMERSHCIKKCIIKDLPRVELAQ